MKATEIAKERRKQDRLEKLGTQKPACSQCGETDDRCLEAHHIAGRAYSEDTVILCRNCHRKVSDDQKDHPKGSAMPVHPLEIAGRILMGLADLLALAATKLKEIGAYVIECAQQLLQSKGGA